MVQGKPLSDSAPQPGDTDKWGASLGGAVVLVIWLLCCSVARLCPTLCDPMDCTTPGFPVLHYLPEFAQTHVHWVSNAIQSSHPVVPFSSCLQSLRASVFSNESALRVRWPKYWSFSISPSNEYSGLIPFRIDWFDLLAVQGTLKSLLQHHSSQPQFLGALLYGPALISIHYWKKHSFDSMDLCQQSDVSAF